MMLKKYISVIFLLLAVCVSVCAFTACGGSGDEEKKTEDPSEVKYPVVLEDNKAFRFEITGREGLLDEYKYKLTNKTKRDFTFSVEKVILAGESTVDAFIYTDVAAGTSAKDSFILSEEDTEGYEEGDKMKLTVYYKLVDPETFDTLVSNKFGCSLVK